MKTFNNYLIIATIAIFAGLIVWLNISRHQVKDLKGEIQNIKLHTDTIITTHLDTIKIIEPKYISVKYIDTLLLPITDTLRINDTLYQPIPKTQKYYEKDSLYRAWVSGYRPELDSLYVFPKTIIKTIKLPQKSQKFNFGIIGGYGISTKGLVPFIGVGIVYNPFKK